MATSGGGGNFDLNPVQTTTVGGKIYGILIKFKF
jgi:hypothetical protein